MYLSMDSATCLAMATASTTVRATMTASPPANTPSRVVLPSSLTVRRPFWLVSEKSSSARGLAMVPLAGGECLPFVGNHAERDMHAVLRPFVSHLFQHTENLAEVQILLIRHDVQALIEMISIMAIDGRRKVAGGVKRRAVGAEDDAGGHHHKIQFVIIHK